MAHRGNKVSFVLFVFGRKPNYYIQARYAILSLMAFTTFPYEIIIITDNTDEFSMFGEEISFIKITPEIMREWQGKYHFFWRAELVAVLKASKKTDNILFYIDSDIIVHKSLMPLLEKIQGGYICMYTKEKNLHTMGKRDWLSCRFKEIIGKDISKTTYNMAKKITNKQWNDIKVTSQHFMWNFGVLGLAKEYFYVLQQALDLCDNFYEQNIKKETVGQLALSIVCAEAATMVSADEFIYHYWNQKEKVTAKITKQFTIFDNKNLTVDQQIQYIKELGLNPQS